MATIPHHLPKANSVRFEDPYDHIHHINNHNEHISLLNPQEQDKKKNGINGIYQDGFYDEINDD